ncbi:hypothetical protein [Candidatus Endomicrobiellum agilis]|uniref:hypothetical protein n=1 Tax=Candidatus Endomicrobiellum agilis TaxID=3238957 RepID=UPI0035799732|nr:hypothetical protein [Endomicrobium sp.]
MKKIISVCLCICLMSGCDKLLSHGRPANAVVEDKGSEGVSTHSLTSDTSNASASTPEAQPASDSAVSSSWISWHGYVPTINVNNSVLYWTLNAVGYAFAFIALIVGGYDVFRYFKPERRAIFCPCAGLVSLSRDQINDGGVYKYCGLAWDMDSSYTWYFAKRTTTRYFYVDEEGNNIDSKIPVYKLQGELSVYVYKPAPSK